MNLESLTAGDLFAGSSIIVGLWITAVGWRDIILAWQSRKWPMVTGYIAEKVFREGLCTDLGNDGTFAPQLRKWKEMDLLYRYRAIDKDYSSTKFDFGIRGLHSSSHYYEDGEKVAVYYCPDDPKLAVLRPGIRSEQLVGPVLIILGILLFADKG